MCHCFRESGGGWLEESFGGNTLMKSILASVVVRAVLLILVGSVSLASGQSPVPFLSLPLVPGAVTPGSAGFTLTANGTGFVSGSTVYWNGSARATTYVNASQLTASILATDVASAGTALVTVSSPTPGGGLSNFALFEITTPVTAFGFTRTDWTVGNSPSAIAAGNFDGNGTLDLAVTNKTDNTVSILLSNGNGTFQPHVDYATGTGPVAVVTGDFNGDGILDLAVANSTANTVTVLLGNGNGTFQAKPDFYTGTGTQNPVWLAVGDFNRDGNLDLAVANEATNTIAIFLGNGTGTFTLKSTPTVATPTSVEVGDFNGDGLLDLVVASSTANTVTVLLGNGDGTFKTGTVLSNIKTDPYSVTVGDFNLDGNLDFAMGNETSGTTNVAFGEGNGTFETPLSGYSTGSAPSVEVAADLNGDGYLDLITSNLSTQSTFSYLLNNGGGTFQFHINYGTGMGPLGLTVGDFNNDGMLDLAVAASTENTTGAVTIMTQVPPLTPSAASLTFANTPVEITSPGQNLIITNNLSKSVVINSIVVAGEFAETGTCKSIATLGSCTLNVTFTPTAMGTQTGSIIITDSAIATPVVVNLTGKGIAQAQLTPATYAFGNVTLGSQPTEVFTLQNNLNTAITISSIAVASASGEFSQQSTTCGTRLAARNKCTITVAFSPTKAGSVNGSLTVTDSAYGATQKSTFAGTGVK
jgi:hypothetical protein